MAKATVMAVVNQKGGTGKTTTCENLGVGLAMEGKKVLLVDTDPQASLTICLGHPVPDQLSPTLSDMMGKILSEQPIAPGEGILHHPEGVDLMPANIELSGLEVSLVNAMSRETILKQYLDTVKQNYDFILLDCMPSLGMLTVNALAAADNVLIPVQAAYTLTKRLGAEVDYIVKGIDGEAGIAVASRLEAMAARRRSYYFGTDRDGNNLLYEGVCAEARVVSVIRAGIFVDLFGLETYIPLRELSYQRMLDASAVYQPGQRILVKILRIDRSDREHIRVAASIKQAGENPYEKALRRYSVGNRYVGTVSMVDTTGVFVALDGGIDCLCSYPKRGRPPRGARVTIRILGINHETNRIWGAITHVATPR